MQRAAKIGRCDRIYLRQVVARMKKTDARKNIPLIISIIYAGAGLVWVLIANALLYEYIKGVRVFAESEVLKGWIFVLLTSVLIYFLARRYIRTFQKSERVLRESEERFQTLVERTSSAIFIYRQNMLFANSTMEALTGYSREELTRMSFGDLIDPEFRAEVMQKCEAFLKGFQKPEKCEFKIIRKDGQLRWIDFTTSLINYYGAPAGLGTAFDITGQKEAYEALRKSEERYRLVVQSVSDYEIFVLDTEGCIVAWNLGAEKGKGYVLEEVIGEPHSIFFTQKDMEAGLPQKELDIARRDGHFEDEGWRVRKDGSLFWANVVTTAMRDEKGELKGFSKVIRDITRRKAAEDLLRESEERYRIILETASDAVITIDEDSRAVLVNRAVEKIFGYKEEEVLGRVITILMPERYKAAHLAAIKRYIETGKAVVNWEYREIEGLRKDGTEVPLEISYGVFRKDGKFFFTGIARDRTERQQAEKEKKYKDMLERFNEELETVVAERTLSLMALRLADQVRGPASIIGLAGRKLEQVKGISPDLRENISMIMEEGQKLEAMVRDFQSLLKARQPVFTYQDINGIIRGVLEVVKREAEAKRVEITDRLPGIPLRINAQRELLRMAVFSLLRNAVEATPEGGRVIISAYAEKGNVVFSVSDGGPGMPKEAVEKLFDPFYSARVYRFGMGLPLIKQIIAEHLGQIEVDSAPGAGTTFKIILPVRWMQKALRAGSV